MDDKCTPLWSGASQSYLVRAYSCETSPLELYWISENYRHQMTMTTRTDRDHSPKASPFNKDVELSYNNGRLF
jgi:hypothetical protein